MQIVTGKTGTNHVTAEDDRALNAATFGTENYVLDIGAKLEANIETSNNITISDGEILMNGTHARIRYGETETVVIENGTTGYNRTDLIVARYKKQSGLESVELAVIKGITTPETPEMPHYTEENILEGAELAEMPLYAVNLEGVNIASVTPLYTIITGMDYIYRKDEVYNKEETKEETQKLIKSFNDEVIDKTLKVPKITKLLEENYVLIGIDGFNASSEINCALYQEADITGTFIAPSGTAYSIIIPHSYYGFSILHGTDYTGGTGTKTYSGRVARIMNSQRVPSLAFMVLHFGKLI